MKDDRHKINYAVVIDACKSGEIIKGLVPEENIDFLTSTGLMEQKEELFNGSYMSTFSL